MTTERVCIKGKYRDVLLKEWLSDPNNVYIGRQFPGFMLKCKRLDDMSPPNLPKSEFANPFTVKEHGREKCLKLYRKHIEGNEALKKKLRKLKGKTLGCFCTPEEDCHGDILIELIESS